MATSTSTASSSTSTSIPQNGAPRCDLGGNVGLSPAVHSTAPAKPRNETLKAQGMLSNCTGFDVFATKFPISGGKIKLQVTLPPGATCSAVMMGAPIKATLKVTFYGIDPKTHDVKTADNESVALASFQEMSGPRSFLALSLSFANAKTTLFGKSASIKIVIDETAEQMAPSCNDKRGLKTMSFTGVNGPSSFTLS
jgi:hypothetical protein